MKLGSLSTGEWIRCSLESRSSIWICSDTNKYVFCFVLFWFFFLFFASGSSFTNCPCIKSTRWAAVWITCIWTLLEAAGIWVNTWWTLVRELLAKHWTSFTRERPTRWDLTLVFFWNSCECQNLLKLSFSLLSRHSGSCGELNPRLGSWPFCQSSLGFQTFCLNFLRFKQIFQPVFYLFFVYSHLDFSLAKLAGLQRYLGAGGRWVCTR